MPRQGKWLCPRCRQAVPHGPCPNCSSGWSSKKPKSWSAASGRTGSKKWRRVRADVLAERPYCEWCHRPATVGDHLDGTDYEDDSGVGYSWLNPQMVRPLCRPCHNRRTGQQGNRASRGLPPLPPVPLPPAPKSWDDEPYEI